MNARTLGRALAAACAVVAAAHLWIGAAVGRPLAFAIPAQSLAGALAAFEGQSGMRVTVDPSLVAGLESAGVSGTMEPEAAVQRLLAGSGYVAQRSGEAMVITRTGAPPGIDPGAIDPNAIQLQTIDVAGAAAAGSDPGRTEGGNSYAAPSTHTATRLDLAPRETPQTVQVVTQKAIQDFNATSARRALELAPGVQVEAERNEKAFQYFSRGYLLQNQFDGVPSPLQLGDRDSITPDTAILDRVEILQGPSGLVNGAGAPGGVVNLVRKMPMDVPQTSVEVNAGSWNTFRLAFDSSGPLNESGSVRGRLVAVHDQSDGYVEATQGKKAVLYGVLQADLGDDTTVTAGVDIEAIYDASNGANYGNPMYHDGSDPGLSAKTNLGADWARDERSSQTVFVRLDHRLVAEWVSTTMLTAVHRDTETLESTPWGSIDPDTGKGAQLWAAREAWESTTLVLDSFVKGPVELFGRRHELMVGVNASRYDILSDSYKESSVPIKDIDIGNHDPRDVPGPETVPWVDYMNGSDDRTQQAGVFAVGRFEVTDALHAILGGRLSWYDVQSNGRRAARENAVVTPYAGITYDLLASTTLYASYADIFKPHALSTKDKNGDVLPPMVGRNFEVGVKSELLGGVLDTYAAIFRLEQSNLEEIDPTVPFDPGNPCGGDCYRSAGLVVSQGVDVGASGEITPDWHLFGGYTFINHAYAEGRHKGERFRTQSPQHLFKVASTYDLPWENWTVGANLTYQSRIYTKGETENGPYRIEQEGYALVGLMTEYRINERARLLATVDNLFNIRYYSGITDPIHGNVLGEPRRVTVTFRAEF